MKELPRAGIQPRYSGLRVQGTATSPPSTANLGPKARRKACSLYRPAIARVKDACGLPHPISGCLPPPSGKKPNTGGGSLGAQGEEPLRGELTISLTLRLGGVDRGEQRRDRSRRAEPTGPRPFRRDKAGGAGGARTGGRRRASRPGLRSSRPPSSARRRSPATRTGLRPRRPRGRFVSGGSPSNRRCGRMPGKGCGRART